MNEESLTQEYLKECLNYDPETGIFTWCKRPEHHCKDARASKIWNTRYSNTKAGYINDQEYRVITIENSHFRAHRLAWLYVHGKWPKGQIDHIYGNRSDNRIKYLRDVTNQQNHQNMRRSSSNTSGQTGVHWRKETEKWVASIMVDYKSIGLGCFDVIEDAIMARKSAELKYGFHPNHGL